MIRTNVQTYNNPIIDNNFSILVLGPTDNNVDLRILE